MIKEYKDIDLRPFNTFGISVRCARLAEFETVDDLRRLFARPEIADGMWAVLGGGSNIVFTRDYDGTLLHPAGKRVDIAADHGDSVTVRAEAGVVWDDLAGWCADNGLWGAENLSHIPGLVGAAPVQNIGAYGAEAKDIISNVELYDTMSGATMTLAGEHCGFGYRDSIFKHGLKGRVIITAVAFTLRRTAAPELDYGDLREKTEALGGPTLRNIRDAVIAIRRGKLPEPSETGNAGSFFKNPVVPLETAERLRSQFPGMPSYPAGREGYAKLAAGWLIDRAGWKGRSLGPVGVHGRQALVLVNLGGATGADVMALAEKIQADVADRFGIEIETEINVW